MPAIPPLDQSQCTTSWPRSITSSVLIQRRFSWTHWASPFPYCPVVSHSRNCLAKKQDTSLELSPEQQRGGHNRGMVNPDYRGMSARILDLDGRSEMGRKSLLYPRRQSVEAD